MLLTVFRILCVLLLLAALACGLWGYQQLSQSWPLTEQAKKLFNEAYDLKAQNQPWEALEQQALDFSARARDLRRPGEQWTIVAAVLGGVGLLGLVLPPLIGATVRTFRPKRIYASYEELIRTEAGEQLQADEPLFNAAKVIRGWGRRWDTYCVLLTDRIIGCATDQHWKGNDILFEFPEGELRLRLHFTGNDVSGQRQFWEQVPARFAHRAPSAAEIVEGRRHKRSS